MTTQETSKVAKAQPNVHGIIPAMVTPFDVDQNLNLDALTQLVEHLIAGGVHGLFPTGSQGEFWALTPGERQRVWDAVVAAADGRVPVYAGTGAPTTREVIGLNRLAERVGVSAVSVITPYFINPTQDELLAHYTAIADATTLPVILYTNPGRTGGLNLSVDVVSKLAEHPNIVGIKDSSGDLSQTMAYIEHTGDDFVVLLGRDTLIYAGLMHGARGAITATANAAPRLVVSIYEAYREGRWEEALAAQQRLAPLRTAFGLGTFPVVVKEALTILGIPAGPARSPVGPMAPEQRRKLAAVLAEMG
ncbi:MAG: 4-hydroxy-tetrahydrodipicolinate synthase [Anaerolineae bacterium]|nr:4-hydroxy-tetrahydrodipicolinate synthase [Anaerolineae bacterium]